MPADPTLDLIDRLYAAALAPEGWPDALEALAHAVGGVGAVIVPVSSPSGVFSIASPSLVEPNVAYERHWWRHDRRIEYFRAQRATFGVVTDSQAVSDDDVRRDPFYQDFLRPNGFGACMAQVLSPSADHVVAVSVQRDLRLGGFERDAMERFAVVGRHAARALTASARLAEANRVSRLVGSAMQHAACGLAVLDGAGRVIHADAGAQAALGDGLAIREGRLRAVVHGDQKRLDALVHAALGRGPPGLADALATVPIQRRSRPLPLLLQAVPVRTPPESPTWEAVVLGPGALILIHDPGAPLGASTARAFTLLGLTPGQARVADAMGRGLSVTEAAADLGLAEATVRTVLKAVYDRLGLSRQSQLAILATRLRSMVP